MSKIWNRMSLAAATLLAVLLLVGVAYAETALVDKGVAKDGQASVDKGPTADTGATVDTGATADTGATTDGTTQGDGKPPKKDDDDGCSCEVGSTPGSAGALLVLGLGLVPLFLRRRRP